MALELVLASANPDKVAEIQAILGPTVTLLPRPPEVPDVVEDAPTLEGNARLKAEALVAATGKPAVADDTGLSVDHLNGDPGVFTARYAGVGATYAENVEKLLRELEGVEPHERTARFATVALVAFPDGTEVVAHGVVEGTITEEAMGEGGFGYDPVFVPEGDGGDRTFAQMDPDEKHEISHRGRAFRALAHELAESGLL